MATIAQIHEMIWDIPSYNGLSFDEFAETVGVILDEYTAEIYDLDHMQCDDLGPTGCATLTEYKDGSFRLDYNVIDLFGMEWESGPYYHERGRALLNQNQLPECLRAGAVNEPVLATSTIQ